MIEKEILSDDPSKDTEEMEQDDLASPPAIDDEVDAEVSDGSSAFFEEEVIMTESNDYYDEEEISNDYYEEEIIYEDGEIMMPNNISEKAYEVPIVVSSSDDNDENDSDLDSYDGYEEEDEQEEEHESELFILETPEIEDVSSLEDEEGEGEEGSEHFYIIEEVFSLCDEAKAKPENFQQSVDWGSFGDLSLNDSFYYTEDTGDLEDSFGSPLPEEETKDKQKGEELAAQQIEKGSISRSKLRVEPNQPLWATSEARTPMTLIQKISDHPVVGGSSPTHEVIGSSPDHAVLGACTPEARRLSSAVGSDKFSLPAFSGRLPSYEGDDDYISLGATVTAERSTKVKAIAEAEAVIKDVPLFWGREAELQRMRKALDGTQIEGVNNAPRIVWIYGNAGIGKTFMVEDFVRRLPATTCVCCGCFEEKVNTTKSFSAIVNCLVELVDNLIRDSDVGVWKERVRDGLGKEAKLLATLVPNFDLLLEMDDKDKVISFDISTARLFDRLKILLRRFLRLVCKYQTVLLVLDDLHWADDDSLTLMEAFLSTNALNNLFFIGCHRGVKRTHRLPKVKSNLVPLCAADIMMKNLDPKVTKELVVGHLDRLVETNSTLDGIVALSNLLFEKTGGNPLFLVQLIRFLYDKKILLLTEDGWEWDSDAILRDEVVPSNAIDLVTERIRMMSRQAKLVVKSAGFLGLKCFRVETLYQAVMAYYTVEKKEAGPCPIHDIVLLAQLLDSSDSEMIVEKVSTGCYRFTHDTMREAAISLLPKAKTKRTLLHFRFASELIKLKLSNSSVNQPMEKEELKLLVVDHYSAAAEHIKSDEDKQMLAKLNLELAGIAVSKASFSQAIRRIESGLSVLDPETRWKHSYELTLKLHLELAQLKFCRGDLDEAKVTSDVIITHGIAERDKVGAYELLIWLSLSINAFDESFRLVLLALKEVWNETPRMEVEQEVAKLRGLLNEKSDADLLILPKMTHKKATNKMVFLARLAHISGLRQDYLHQDLAALRMTELTLQYGASSRAGLAFSLYGICLARRGLHGEAYRFGHLAEMMSTPANANGAQAIANHHWYIHHWRKPLQASLGPLRKVSNAAIDSNDMENVSFRVGAFLSLHFVSGGRLQSCDSLFRRFRDYAMAFGARDSWLVTIPYRAMLKLRGEKTQITDKRFGNYTGSPRAIQYETFFRMLTAVFLQDLKSAEKMSAKLFLKPEGVWVPYRGFIEGLIATYHARNSTGKARIKHQRKAARIIDVLGTWAKKGLRLGFHMANLLNVELRLAIDNDMPPMRTSYLYDTAIDAATQDGFLHHEALANERAGLYFLSIQEELIASRYLSQACRLYSDWGAQAKVRYLRSKYETILNGRSETLVRIVTAGGNRPVRPFSEQRSDPFDPQSRRAFLESGRGYGTSMPTVGRGPLLSNRGRGSAPGRGTCRTIQGRGRGPPGKGPGRAITGWEERGPRPNFGPGRTANGRGRGPGGPGSPRRGRTVPGRGQPLQRREQPKSGKEPVRMGAKKSVLGHDNETEYLLPTKESRASDSLAKRSNKKVSLKGAGGLNPSEWASDDEDVASVSDNLAGESEVERGDGKEAPARMPHGSKKKLPSERPKQKKNKSCSGKSNDDASDNETELYKAKGGSHGVEEDERDSEKRPTLRRRLSWGGKGSKKKPAIGSYFGKKKKSTGQEGEIQNQAEEDFPDEDGGKLPSLRRSRSLGGKGSKKKVAEGSTFRMKKATGKEREDLHDEKDGKYNEKDILKDFPDEDGGKLPSPRRSRSLGGKGSKKKLAEGSTFRMKKATGKEREDLHDENDGKHKKKDIPKDFPDEDGGKLLSLRRSRSWGGKGSKQKLAEGSTFRMKKATGKEREDLHDENDGKHKKKDILKDFHDEDGGKLPSLRRSGSLGGKGSKKKLAEGSTFRMKKPPGKEREDLHDEKDGKHKKKDTLKDFPDEDGGKQPSPRRSRSLGGKGSKQKLAEGSTFRMKKATDKEREDLHDEKDGKHEKKDILKRIGLSWKTKAIPSLLKQKKKRTPDSLPERPKVKGEEKVERSSTTSLRIN
jgi:predicted ATPase